MGGGSGNLGGSLAADIVKWKHVGGDTDRDGNAVEKPLELYQAEIVDAICQRYSCLPSELYKEDVSLMRLLHIVGLNEAEAEK